MQLAEQAKKLKPAGGAPAEPKDDAPQEEDVSKLSPAEQLAR